MKEQKFQVNNPFTPIPFRYAGKQTLVYESVLANKDSQNWNIRQIDIFDRTASGRLISHQDAKEIRENSRFLTSAFRPATAEILEPDLISMVFYWLTFDEEIAVPSMLHHQFLLEDENGNQQQVELDVPVQSVKPITIQPPIRGNRWVAAEGASNATHHRRTPIPYDGIPYIAQRYAVDWVKFDDEGNLFKGSPEKNENWFCYGAELHAVADGVVTKVLDGFIENTPLCTKMAIEITLDTASGNMVIIDLGGGNFAFYAHMIPGSISVKEGYHVKCGQVIGRLGNSGNSDAPHLHFHIGDRNSPLGAHGLPYHFPEYERIGNSGSIDDLLALYPQIKSWSGEQTPEIRRDEYIKCNDVINFLAGE